MVWPHAIHNCVPVRIILGRDLSNSSITLTSKGYTRLFSRFHVFAWYRTKSDRHVLRRMLLNPKKKIVPTTDYRVLTKKMKDFIEKSKVTILTYINMISYEYEYFGSARTPDTKSSTRDHTASLFCVMQRTTSMYVSYEYA